MSIENDASENSLHTLVAGGLSAWRGFGGVLEGEIDGSDANPSYRSTQRLATDLNLTSKDNRALFDEVFLPNLAEAYRLAQWLTGNASDAEDVVQDAAIRAFRGINGFGAINARAWSLTIVRNTAYSWLLKNRPKAVVFVDDLSPIDQRQVELENTYLERAETPEDAVILKADIEDVQRALALLPAPFREIIILREMHQLNYKDIAEITNTPIGTVMSRLSRARQLLIGHLGDRRP